MPMGLIGEVTNGISDRKRNEVYERRYIHFTLQVRFPLCLHSIMKGSPILKRTRQI